MPQKKTIPSAQKKKSEVIPQNSTSDARPRRRAGERLPTSILEELWSIWRADPRVPSIRSRRSWAIARNANPRLVDSWFCRRRTCAKKAGEPISEESYDLPLDPPIFPKREQSATPIEPEPENIFDLPSDDTLVLVYPPDDKDLNNIEASSDTVLEDAYVDTKETVTTAYKEVLEHHQNCCSDSFPEPSFTDHGAAENHEDVSFENSLTKICDQGLGEQSGFTCILCSTTPIQGAPDEVVFDSNLLSDPKNDLFVSCPRLDFLSNTIPELSAIPFLFRTPSTVLPNNPRTEYSWTNVEDELDRLVNEGGLDFSFLDAPELTSLELPD